MTGTITKVRAHDSPADLIARIRSAPPTGRSPTTTGQASPTCVYFWLASSCCRSSSSLVCEADWLLKLRVVVVVFRPARKDKLHKVRTRTIIRSDFMGSSVSVRSRGRAVLLRADENWSHKPNSPDVASDETRRRSGAHALHRSRKTIDETSSSRRSPGSAIPQMGYPAHFGNV
jgi:hypothetical protein